MLYIIGVAIIYCVFLYQIFEGKIISLESERYLAATSDGGLNGDANKQGKLYTTYAERMYIMLIVLFLVQMLQYLN